MDPEAFTRQLDPEAPKAPPEGQPGVPMAETSGIPEPVPGPSTLAKVEEPKYEHGYPVLPDSAQPPLVPNSA